MMTRATVIDEIFAQFERRGASEYLGEPVSVGEHMLQAAHAAVVHGSEPTLVAAALLHDYGHLLADPSFGEASQGIDTRHEDLGFDFVAQHFMSAVAEPIHLHVAAKRYLCAVDGAYLAALSPASRLSLDLQGGPFDADEIADFERLPYAKDAVRLRRYDDEAKVPGVVIPPITEYRTLLESVLR